MRVYIPALGQVQRFELVPSLLVFSLNPTRLFLLMRRLLHFLTRIPRRLLVGVVRGYQLLVSPHMPRTCRYHPTCSEYAVKAFRTYGAMKGLILTLHRLARCHPWGGHGYDPPRWFGEDASEAEPPPRSPSEDSVSAAP